MHGLYLTIVIINEIIVVLTILHVLMDNRQPVKTMAWAMVIFFVPIAGVVLYVFFGVNTRKEKLMSRRSMTQLAKRSMLEFVEQQGLHIPEKHRQTVDLFVNQNMALPFKDNEVDIMTDGYTFFHALLRDIASATDHIHIDIYIFEDDALGNLIADALIDKARRGVEVRIIYDDVGCWKVSPDFFERMMMEGIEAVAFMPVRFPSFTSKVNYRNHRKIIVIDGKVGYVGGMNFAERYVKGDGKRPWRDTMVRIHGGGVYGLQRAFLVDWYFVDRTMISNRKYYPKTDSCHNNCLTQTVTSSPVAEYPDIMQGYVRLIMAARKYIFIQTPYFMPTEPVLFALKTAATGGIDVRLMVPMRCDSMFVDWAGRSYLREVAKAGVKVLMYDEGFLHSKLLVIDDEIASCGSTNIDFRSFENNFESNMFFYDRETALRFKDVFVGDQEKSVAYEATANSRKLPFASRLWESLTRLLAPVL